MRKIKLENGKEVKISEESYNNLAKSITEEDDASDCCYFDTHIFTKSIELSYINPNNQKQTMFYDEDGFNLYSNCVKRKTGKERGQKIVWRKVNSIDELKKGDLVRLWGDEDDKNIVRLRGIILYNTRDCIKYCYWNANNIINIHTYIYEFEYCKNIEKAVLVK